MQSNKCYQSAAQRFAALLLIASVFIPSFAFARGALPEFADLIESKSPAVVKITTQATVGRSSSIPDQFGRELPEQFRRFFDPRQQPERNVGGMGSGFIISADGYVLTNNHVVDNADEITVRLADRREFEAEVIGTDPRSDLALLKIEGKKLPYLEFADADDVRVGDWVLAIGSPFGLDFSASQGIVSAIGRSIRDDTNGSYVPFIQTDVAINPGNSGGPLFNLDGKVVGINSQIYTRSGGYMGLSFAIPSDLAQSVVAQLKDKGRVDRGYLGVMIRTLDKDLAQAFGLKKAEGALVEQVTPDGPADKSGIKAGDVILKFNGQDINTSDELPPVVGTTTPGTKVPVDLMREGKQKTIRVEVGTLDSDTGVAATPAKAPAETSEADRLGLFVEEADSNLKESIGIDHGVFVTQVERDSPAAEAGLRRGDVIVQIGFKEIDSLKSYQALVKDIPAGELQPIRFFRQGQPAFRSIRIPKD